jgi:hypothetical protein
MAFPLVRQTISHAFISLADTGAQTVTGYRVDFPHLLSVTGVFSRAFQADGRVALGFEPGSPMVVHGFSHGGMVSKISVPSESIGGHPEPFTCSMPTSSLVSALGIFRGGGGHLVLSRGRANTLVFRDGKHTLALFTGT